MAAGIFQPFASAGRVIFRGGDLFFTSLRLALVTSAWLPDIDTETSWGEISSHEIPSGDGYTAGGKTLENVSISDVEGGMKLSSSQARWDASGAGIPAWRYMVLYIAGTVGGVVNPLIAFALGDDTPADVPLTPSGNSLIIPCPDNGWVKLSLLTADDFATKVYADLQLVLAKAYTDAKDLIRKAYVDAREAAILNAVHPVGSYYTQYPAADSNDDAVEFPASERPETLFGGTWAEQWSDESVYFRTRGTLSDTDRVDGQQADAMQKFARPVAANTNNLGAVINGGGDRLGVISGQRSDSDPNGDYTCKGGAWAGDYLSSDYYKEIPGYGTPRVATETRTVNRRIKVWKRTA